MSEEVNLAFLSAWTFLSLYILIQSKHLCLSFFGGRGVEISDRRST